MNYFIFRNYTVEPFFKSFEARFSGYEDVSFIDETADAYIWFYLMPYELSNDVIAEKIKHYGGLLDMVYSRIGKDKEFIIFTVVPFYTINYVTSSAILEEAVEEYNRKVYNMAAYGNVKIIDIKGFLATFPNEQLIDWKYYFISQIPVNPKLAPPFCRWFSRQLEILAMKRKKCIVLDLDNTLWFGVLGEDGMDGIKMAGDYPGNAFRFFQEYLLELNRNGVILAICSKNNESDATDVLENHPDMLLKKNVFSSYRINWNNKADNIRDIASELNIGLDSMVFIDDSPAERELVRQALPQVSVPEFPASPYLYPVFIKQLTDAFFSAYALTREDLAKTRQYRENAERNQHKGQFADMGAYLRSLEMRLTVEKLDGLNKARFAQMTQKTNQFNLTTKRYTEADIQSFADKGGLVYGLRVKDKFGDSGLTGLIMVAVDNKTAFIDTLLLSCRVLGRGIENVFINHILKKLKKFGISNVKAVYFKTAKNAQVEKFYDIAGFTVKSACSDRTDYEIALANIENTLSNIYTLEDLCGNE
jgi:FkbH-like protein